jgi:chromosome segregation ATPase
MQTASRLAPWIVALAVMPLVIVGCAQKTPEIVALEEENAALRAEMDQMNTRLTSATEDANSAEAEIRELRRTLDAHLDRMASVEADTQTQTDRLAALQQRLTAAETETRRLRELEDANMATDAQIARLEAQIAELIAAHEQAKRMMQQMQQREAATTETPKSESEQP